MYLVSSSKLLYGRDIPAQKYNQLNSTFDRPELYNLTATYTGNGGCIFLLCCLYENIALFFMFYLKLYIMVWRLLMRLPSSLYHSNQFHPEGNLSISSMQ